MPYLLDTNVFLQAKNLHYGFDFCPAFWGWLAREHQLGVVFSVDKVAVELADPDAANWVASCAPGFFIKPTAATAGSLTAVSTWVQSQPFTPAAVNTFLQVADYYLVAQARELGLTVVTHEVHSNSQNRVKIPNVCLGLGIDCKTPFEMLRIEQARFIL